MPGEQSPGATVHWPVQSGRCPRWLPSTARGPETGFDGDGQARPSRGPLIRADEVGSYVLTGPGGTGKTQLAAAYARSLWQSRDTELLVWITASSRAAILAGYAEAFAQDEPGAPAGRAAADASRRPARPASYGRGEDQEQLAQPVPALAAARAPGPGWSCWTT